MPLQLTGLTEDILLAVLQDIQVKDILSLRQACRRLNELTRLRLVWLNACKSFVIDRGLPFPYENLDDLGAVELEQRTRRSLSLANAWTCPGRRPCRTLSFVGGPLNCLHSVHFVLRREHEWIIALSNGIWPVIACWDLHLVENQAPTHVGDWFCKGATITDVVVDSNITSDTSLAASIDQYSAGKRYIEIQKIIPIEGRREVSFETMKVLNTAHSPVSLNGDTLVTSDEYSETRILNWRTGDCAILKSAEETDEVIQHNKCLQVLITPENIFVARSRSIDLFQVPILHPPDSTIQTIRPLQTCSFGWIDGIAMAPLSNFRSLSPYPPIVTLVRAEQGDPWASDIHSIKHHMICPNPDYCEQGPSAAAAAAESSSAYVLLPLLLSSAEARRDFMCCPTIALGPAGTAIWLGSSIERSSSQLLCSVTWPGSIWSLMNAREQLSGDILWSAESEGEMWTSMDYVENRGCIALGAVDGSVKVLYMVD